MAHSKSGYVSCKCSTCFEIAISSDGKPAFCAECAEAGCDGCAECQVEPEIFEESEA